MDDNCVNGAQLPNVRTGMIMGSSNIRTLKPNLVDDKLRAMIANTIVSTTPKPTWGVYDTLNYVYKTCIRDHMLLSVVCVFTVFFLAYRYHSTKTMRLKRNYNM